MAVQVAAHFLERPSGGRGVLFSGAPGVPAARVLILGAGTVGANAARIAVGMGAEVVVANPSREALMRLASEYAWRLQTVPSTLDLASRRAWCR
jgi:alanine dehydrogenase